MLGRRDESIAAGREGIARAERMLALGSLALFDDGQHTRALEWSRRLLELYPDDMRALINAACLHARSGQKAEAVDVIERVFARGWAKRDWIEHDPDYDILRDDPRFRKVLEKLK